MEDFGLLRVQPMHYICTSRLSEVFVDVVFKHANVLDHSDVYCLNSLISLHSQLIFLNMYFKNIIIINYY